MKLYTALGKIRFFFMFLTCVIIPGAESEMVEVKRGDPVQLNLRTPLDYISRLTVLKDGTDVLCYCSSEEKGYGCEEFNLTRFSLESGEIDASLTLPDADNSDEGIYQVDVIGKNNNLSNRMFNVTFIEQLAGNHRPTPPFIHSSTAPNLGVIIGVIIVLIIVLILMSIGLSLIFQRCKKKKGNRNNCQAEYEDCELGFPLLAATPDKSIKMVDDNNRSERDLNHRA